MSVLRYIAPALLSIVLKSRVRLPKKKTGLIFQSSQYQLECHLQLQILGMESYQLVFDD